MSTLDKIKESIKVDLAKVDANSDGWITKEQLFEAIGYLGTKTEFEALFDAAEKNERGEVSCNSLVEGFFETMGNIDSGKKGESEKPPDDEKKEPQDAALMQKADEEKTAEALRAQAQAALLRASASGSLVMLAKDAASMQKADEEKATEALRAQAQAALLRASASGSLLMLAREAKL